MGLQVRGTPRLSQPEPELVLDQRTRESLTHPSNSRPATRLHAELRNLCAERPDLRVRVVPGRRRRRRRSLGLHRREEHNFADGVLVGQEHRQSINTCVEINQCVGCKRRQFFTKSFLGDDAAVLARASGEEPASPRHRAGVVSMAWRTTRRFSTNAP